MLSQPEIQPVPKLAATCRSAPILREMLAFFGPCAICERATSSIDPLLLSAQSLDLNDNAKLPHVAGRTILGVTTMANGTVKWFNTTKGYGFIAPESGGKDIFVHISAVERSGLTGLADNQKVTFDLESGRDGRESAVNIALA
jgi:cold shock protein